MLKYFISLVCMVCFVNFNILLASVPSDSVRVLPVSATINTDSTLSLTALTYYLGNSADVTLSATWSTTESGVTIVRGQYHPSAAGSYLVIASYHSQADTCAVTVNAVITDSQVVSAIGSYTFTNAGVQLNFTSLDGAGIITVKCYPGVFPPFLPTENNPVKKYFSIKASAGITAFTAALQLSYTDAELGSSSITDESSLYCARYNGSEWVPFGSVVDVDNNTVTCITTQFSLWGIGGDGDFLPVTLSSFTAEPNGSAVTLQWATASEQGNLGWNILRSINGSGFAQINSALVPGAGSTVQPQAYSFVDNTAMGVCSYKLEQVDVNGGKSYSNAISAVISTASIITRHDLNGVASLAIANPARQLDVTINLNQQQLVSTSVFDLSGRLVNKISGTHITENLLPGLYLVKIEGASFRVTEKVFIIK